MTRLVRAHIIVSGLVQGVFYRATMQEVARSLGVTGWVRNLPDGRVEAVAEGDEEAVKKLIEWAWRGPRLARVENVEVKWEDYRGEFRDFYIRW
ncbi:MAG: acylphosphatase [Thermofilum sp.]|jgi:acylphosphatase|nr:acylphosphatase [Thermofilum sp.]